MNRVLPLIVFVVVAAIGFGMTLIVYRAEEMANRARFEVVASEAADRIHDRVNQHIALVAATGAFMSAYPGSVTRPAFDTFVEGLGHSGVFEGLRGIGYARLIDTGNEALAEADLADNYNLQRQVWPAATDQAKRTPIVMLAPNDMRNQVALGYDMFSEERRRAAMQAALDTGVMRVSAPVELVQEITEDKQAGFLVYIPFTDIPANLLASAETPVPVAGFVYAPFRAGDLHVAALSRKAELPVVVETFDTTDGARTLLYRSGDFSQESARGAYSVDRIFDIGGRQWTVTILEAPEFRSANYWLNVFVLGAISLLLAAAIATSTWFQSKAVSAAEELHDAYEKSVQEKDLMLQEMKHRIKNSISRVMAIARQTVSTSDSLEDFSTSFAARLNAMANAQDMLTRSHWQRADLHELLSRELEQVFGRLIGQDKASGPDISLDERTTQALGLTFHELATNALKYGGITEENADLTIRWVVEPAGDSEKLVLDWEETSATPIDDSGKRSFGSRLIDANIRGELGGVIERDFRKSGLAVRMIIPIRSGAISTGRGGKGKRKPRKPKTARARTRAGQSVGS